MQSSPPPSPLVSTDPDLLAILENIRELDQPLERLWRRLNPFPTGQTPESEGTRLSYRTTPAFETARG